MKKRNLLILTATLFSQLSFAQPTQQWLAKYNGKGDFSDKFNAIALDNSGNVHLAGYSVNPGNKRDFCVVKLNSVGDTLWTRTINGSDNNDDEALAIAVDGSGNVYATGYAKANTSDNDYLTVKYNASGVLQWTASYNYSSNQVDQANSIGIDGSGNVYITGQSDNDATTNVNDDYATVKYNSSGTQQWVMRYNGGGSGTDRAMKIAVSTGGNSYITGRSDNGTDDDYVTIKYSTSGSQTWLKSFDNGANDRGEVLTIDASENVYVSGRSNNGSDDDFLTIKYNSAGTELWTGGVVYDGTGANDDKPTAIFVDGSGNVYVTGRSDSDNSATVNYDFATIKYNSSGSELWVASYNGSGNGSDTPTGITVDGSGNVIVCGAYDADASTTVTNNNAVTISYTSSGTQSWTMTANGTSNISDGANAVASDNSGNVFVAGAIVNTGTQKDGLAIKYTSAGTLGWIKSYNGTGDNSDNVNAIVVDAAGNSYIAGYTYRVDTQKDMSIIKISPIGDTLWTKTYNGTSNSSDEAMDIVVDGTGNVYVTGYSKESVSGYNFCTSKYSPTGSMMWNAQYNNSTVNGTDKASKICLDANGNVYVTGYSDRDISATVTNEDFVTVKYSSTGAQLWATSYNGTGNTSDVPSDISVDGTGNVFVTGKTSNGSDNDVAVIKYNSGGTQQWATIYDGGQGDDQATALYLDASSNTFITGKSFNGSDDDILTAKYNSAGTQQWLTLYDNTISDDRAYCLDVDGAGNVYVAGKSSNGSTDNFTTIKYNAIGTQQWVQNHNGTASGNDAATAIKIDNMGGVIVVGESDNGSVSVPNIDFTMIKYNPAGLQQWIVEYDDADQLTDGINAFAIDNNNALYVTGNSALNSEQKNSVVIKYEQPAGISEVSYDQKTLSIFPNPFTTITTVEIPNSVSNANLQLFDIFGKEVRTIKNVSAGKLTVKRDDLSNGIYIYVLTENEQTINTGKVIIH